MIALLSISSIGRKHDIFYRPANARYSIFEVFQIFFGRAIAVARHALKAFPIHNFEFSSPI
jgi:hypothetical protein